MKYDICGFGEILIDFTPDGIAEYGYPRYIQNPGGGPANLTAAGAGFGSPCAFIGKIGNDAPGKFAKGCLMQAGVDVSGIVTDDEYNTTLAFVTLLPDGERDFTFYRRHEADIRLSPDEVNCEIIASSRVLHVDCLSLTDEPCRSATMKAIETAKKNGTVLSYDPNYRANLCTAPDSVERMTRMLDHRMSFVKVSLEEGEMITGTSDPVEIGRRICETGTELTAVTLGKEGSVIVTKGCSFRQHGYTDGIHSIDATGAGDIFWGTFLASFAQSGMTAKEFCENEDVVHKSVRLASIAAALSTEKKGGIPSVPGKAEVIERERKWSTAN